MSETEDVSVVVVGGGQAGLSVSWHLTHAGIDHVVLERDTALHSWQDARWDSFCLVTPNWQCVLPGYPYRGPEPDGFMVKDELIGWLQGYAPTFAPPVREHTPVLSVRPVEGGAGFDVRTPEATWRAEQVVVATGGYHRPKIPRVAERLPGRVGQVHSSTYRNADELPPGPVLVVGTGQSGAQIAEDLMLAGRDVHLAVGSAPRVARRHRGRDVVAWLNDMGNYDRPVTEQPPEERQRDRTNHYVTGRDGGHDIDLRAFAQRGMHLYGHLVGIDDGRLRFAGDLGASLDAADAVYTGINAAIDTWIEAEGIEAPPADHPVTGWSPPADAPAELAVDDIAAVVWATGFARDDGWLHASAFDGAGLPTHLRGVTTVPGLYFIGLPWLHTWGSGRFAAVARDAEYLSGIIRERRSDPVADADTDRTDTDRTGADLADTDTDTGADRTGADLTGARRR